MLFWVNIVLLCILLGILGNQLYLMIQTKRSATMLEEADFKEGMRKAQVIDVREKDAFSAGHILGARNIPYTILKQSMDSIRKDQPIYLYDQRKSISVRAANKLRKAGYKNMFILKGGYEDWTGKIKKKNA